MARTILSREDLIKIEKDYGIISNSALSKKWHIGISRLTSEMETLYKSQKIDQSKRRRIAGTRITEEEVAEIILQYTEHNGSITSIAKLTARSTTSVRNTLLKHNIPIRTTKTSYKVKSTGDFITKIVIGDKVYSDKYNAYAVVVKLIGDAYRIWVEDVKSENSGGFFAYQSRTQLAFISKGSIL